MNRKEGNDQESIQLPNTFHSKTPRHQRGRRTHIKKWHHNQNTTSRKLKGQVLPKKWPNGYQNKKFTKTYMQRHTLTDIVNHSKSTALEQSVKVLLGGLNWFYMATNLALIPAVVYTRLLFNLRKCFLTHQCNISENIKIKQIQRWNNNEDSIARNNWNAEAKENEQKTV